jgi:glucose/arabinose dehydrogenase
MGQRHARLLCALLVTLALLLPSASGAAPPTGFSREIVPGLNELSGPTAFDFLPDGGMLIATKSGKLMLYQGGALRAQPVFDRESSTCDNSERGLLGVAVDPTFATNRFVFVYYTFNKFSNNCPTNSETDPVNRVSRLTLSEGFTTTSELVLVDNIPSPNGNHNAGDLQFGKDGYLYISAGDGGRNDTARQLHNLDGAILRITRDGTIPADNPFQGSGSARCYDPAPGGNKDGFVAPGTRCQEIFAFGLRNPFRIAFDPNAAGTRFFINDVGQGNGEEISAGQAGADYGWNCYEGTNLRKTNGDGVCNPLPQNTVPPTFEYKRPTPQGQPAYFDTCASITGGAFVPAGLWPISYDGAYLFADYVCGRMFALMPNGGGFTSALFDGAAGAATHMDFGPDGALYYADINAGDIVRVRYTGSANRSPTARLSADPDFGNPPLEVSFDASASSDPDGGDSIVAFLWDFGDGTSIETTTATTTHTYAAEGVYSATLRVRDSAGALSANPATARIDVGNDPPTAQIIAPEAGAQFSAGEQITLRGSASDPEDGTLGGERLSWVVLRHHDTHFHPYVSGETGAEVSFTAPAPEELAAVRTSWLEIQLTATDSLSRTTTITRELRPRIVTLSFESQPPGLSVSVNDGVGTATLETPASVDSWPGYALTLSAPADQSAGGVPMKLCGWRHGGEPTQPVTTPIADRAYTAIFGPASQACAAQVGDVRVYAPMGAR